MKQLYVLREVLTDYTSGMVVIIATDVNECRNIFAEKFSYRDELLDEFEDSILKHCEVIPVSENEVSRIVSYVFGGA